MIGQPAPPPLPVPDDLDASLVVCRHGESTWIPEGRFQGAADPPLSALGERQAALLAGRLAAPGRPPSLPIPLGRPTAIWHSPLSRTTATAAAAAEALATPLTPDDDLREIGQGAWEGRLVTDILAADGDRLRAWRRSPVGNEAPGGETLAEADRRARGALARIVDALVVASHEHGAADPDRAPVLGYGGPPLLDLPLRARRDQCHRAACGHGHHPGARPGRAPGPAASRRGRDESEAGFARGRALADDQPKAGAALPERSGQRSRRRPRRKTSANRRMRIRR